MRIYIASKACHRPRWRQLRNQGAPFISRWIDIEDGLVDEAIDFQELWEWCIEDIRNSDVLIAVVNPDERLKGVLIEVGAALAYGKRVIVVGDPGRDNGTWVNHPDISWHKCSTIERCLDYLLDKS